MNHKVRLFLFFIMLFFAGSSSLSGQSLLDFQHLTESENHGPHFCYTAFGTPDTMDWDVHSNDFIRLKYFPQFHGHISSSQDRFQEYAAMAYFRFEPIFNAPEIEIPENISHLRNSCDTFIDSDGFRRIIKFYMRMDSIEICTSPLGVPDLDSTIAFIVQPQDHVIFVDGDVEVSGILSGTLTIASTGNIYLPDNCRYFGANRLTGMFEEEEMEHMLGLISERNVIIKNTLANGRVDGDNEEPNNHNRHSIAINAAILTLGESFTFENQNHDWDRYQGPEPDERGIIYHKGALIQKRKGFVFRVNHIRTGYREIYHYDFRFQHQQPPGLAPGDFPELSGRFRDVLLGKRNLNYQIRHAYFETLRVLPGVEIELDGWNSVTVRDSLIIQGTEENPVIIRQKYPQNSININVSLVADYVEMSRVILSPGVLTNFNARTIIINNCLFQEDVNWTGEITVDSSEFTESAVFTCWDDLAVTRSVFLDGLKISGNMDEGIISNCTFTNSNSYGFQIRRFRNLDLVNNIIAFNRTGIDNDHWEEPDIRYSDVYGNRIDNYMDCSPGDGCISEEPQFADREGGDLSLLWESPCRNSGDPESPLDPDGTRADMGVYYFDQELKISTVETFPEEFQIKIFPNPFNSILNVTFVSSLTGNFEWKLYDIKGSLASSGIRLTNIGLNRVILGSNNFQTAGVYFLEMKNGNTRFVEKVVYLP